MILFCFSLCLQLGFPAAGNAQVRPVNDYGALGIGRLLKRLNNTGSVMMIGAHPDDEDSSLLAYLARGENARTAYLSLTRGDGGQNIIGPELFESLGVIRTEELLQARRLDGAEQLFARAFDYGFSKSLEEAKQKWDEKVIICDAVTAIRTFRPLVVIARFSGTPSDGHGQHQYSGYIAPLAVHAAADPKQCIESGPVWQVQKFYREICGQPTLRINTGQFDTMLGRSYGEIAIEGRSLHRSQGEGRIEPRGEQFSSLSLIEAIGPKASTETDIFDGIDTTLTGLPKTYHVGTGISDATKSRLTSAQTEAEEALSSFNIKDPAKSLPGLVSGRDAVAELLLNSSLNIFSGPPERMEAHMKAYRDGLPELGPIAEQLGLFDDAIKKILGLQIDALADAETVVPGEQLSITTRVYFPKNPNVVLKKIDIQKPDGWNVTTPAESGDANAANGPRRDNSNASARFIVDVPRSASVTTPYWLTDPRDGDLFGWPKTASQTRPFDPPTLSAGVTMVVNGKEITFNQPIQYRYADPARGEIRREVNVVPALSLNVDQKLLIIPQSDKPQTRTLTLSITNDSAKPVAGVDALNIPVQPEWNYTKSSPTFSLKSKGEKTSVSFDVTIPAKTRPGIYHIYPNAMVGEGLSTQTMNTIAYPHIQTHRYYTRTETVVNVLDLKVAPVKVGYIMGSGDEVPEAMHQMGLTVSMLDEKDLASGDLSKYDTIVVGIRASETRPDYVANNKRLFDYVRNGGNMIVQYQRGQFAQSGLAPFSVNMADTQRTAAGSIARVVDENAKVTILEPNSPVFNFPNKIGDDDFKGWVQERNAYNMATFDPQYTPLLESHDAGEQENKGGLVTVKLGKGNWTYCSYSFFRQLPAGVSGAYRLFANMLSLPKVAAPKK